MSAENSGNNSSGDETKPRWYELPFDVIIGNAFEAAVSGAARMFFGLIDKLF